MILVRIIFVVFLALYMFYYMLVIGHLFELWKLTNEEITFKKLLIPFYYLFKLKN